MDTSPQQIIGKGCGLLPPLCPQEGTSPPRPHNQRLPILSPRHWRTGVPSIKDEMDIAFVSQVFKFLANEKDPRVSTVVRHQLTLVMCKRTQATDPSAKLSIFLNSPAPNGEGSRGDVCSLWHLVHKSLHNTHSKILLGENNQDQHQRVHRWLKSEKDHHQGSARGMSA